MRPLRGNNRSLTTRVRSRAALAACLLMLASVVHAAPETMRIRVYWGGGAPQVWSGSISAEGGEVGQLSRLSVDPFNAATTREGDATIKIQAAKTTRHNALDFTLRTGEAEQLEVELDTPEAGAQRFAIPIEQLAAEAYNATLTGGGGQLVVQRVAEDRLRIDTGRKSLILNPGESLPLNLVAYAADAEPLSPADVIVEVSEGRGGTVLSTQTHRIEFPMSGPGTLATNVALPTAESVYTIRVKVIRPPGLTKRFFPRATGRVLLERDFQVVVFDAQQRRELQASGQLLAEIDPSAPRWWERVPRWVWPRRLPHPNQHIGSVAPLVVGSPDTPLVELPGVKASTGTGDWHAYQLPVSGVGQPHMVEIEYPADQPQTLTVSVLDKDALGRTTPLGASEEVFVDDWSAKAGDGASPMRTLQRVFWPTTNAPLLLLSNHQDAAARFGKLRVYRLNTTNKPSATPTLGPRAEPLVALGLTSPRLGAAVGASLGLSPDGAFAVDDWQTWYETALRLADLVELGGYNGAVLKVASDQGTVYPSEILASAPGADREPLARSALDLPRKDLLELLHREFDRRGLRLVPAVAFDAAIPQIEATVAQPQQGSLSSNAAYDPLRPMVTKAMNAVVQELAARYGSYTSFAGTAVDLGAGGENSFTLLPTSDVAQTTEQVDRFLADSDLAWPPRVPRNAETTRVALNGPWREQWRAWRQERLTEVYRSLGESLNQAKPSSQLLLLTQSLAGQSAARRVLTPSLTIDASLEQLYESAGISDLANGKAPNVRVVATSETLGGRRLSTERIGRVRNQLASSLGDTPSAPRPTMLTSRPLIRRLATPQANDRLPGALPELAAISVPASATTHLIETLAGPQASVLVEGGPALSQRTDPEASALRRQVAQSLTREKNSTEIISDQPLLIRASASKTGTTVELINRLPWPIESKLTIETKAACSGDWQDDPSVRFEPGQHVLTKTVAPHSIVTGVFDTQAIRVTGVRSTLPESARQALADRVQDLKRRDLTFFSRYPSARNLSFEQLDERGQLVGWQATTDGGEVTLTDRDPKEGATALVVSNNASDDASAPTPRVTLQTLPMPPPVTGQLAVTFHLRTADIRPETRVFVRIEEVGGDYVSSTTLDAERLGGATLALPEQVVPAAENSPEDSPSGWLRPYAFAASDLPADGKRPLRLVFEIVGGGTITIDHLELYDLVFPLDLGAQSNRQKLALLKLVRNAESALDRGDLAECYDILNGYWPRFLQAYTPLVPEPAPEAIAEADPAEPPATEPEEPEATTGWRGYLPRFWR